MQLKYFTLNEKENVYGVIPGDEYIRIIVKDADGVLCYTLSIEYFS